MLSEQRCRAKSGKSTGRGARSRIQASSMADKIIRNVDEPRPAPKPPRKPTKYELEQAITQAHEAVINHPDSVSANNRYLMLINYYNENFGE